MGATARRLNARCVAHGLAWHVLRDTRLSDILLAPAIRRYAAQFGAQDLRQLFAIFSGSTLIMLLGLLDDVFNLSVFTRLLLQTIVAGVTAFVLDIRPVFFHIALCFGARRWIKSSRSKCVASLTTSQRSICPANRATQSSMRAICRRRISSRSSGSQ